MGGLKMCIASQEKSIKEIPEEEISKLKKLYQQEPKKAVVINIKPRT
jgi:hypothetical protein